MTDCQNDNNDKKRGYWCLRVVYTLCQCPESDGRNFLAAIVPCFSCSPLCFLSVFPFFCPSTFFFILCPFPLSPFPPSHLPASTEKPLVSSFLHSISSVPPLWLFSCTQLLDLSLVFFLLWRWLVFFSVFLFPSLRGSCQ
jgi:hypothetical protein